MESSPDKLQNPKSFPKKGMALEQANLCGGPCFVDGEEAQAECPRTQNPSVAGLRLSWSYLCSVWCFDRPISMCGNVPFLSCHTEHISAGHSWIQTEVCVFKADLFQRKTYPRNAYHWSSLLFPHPKCPILFLKIPNLHLPVRKGEWLKKL